MNEQQNPKSLISASHQDFFWISLISISQSFQLLIWFILGKEVIFPALWGKVPLLLQLNWDPFAQISYFRFFVLVVIGLQILWFKLIYRRLTATLFKNSLRRLACAELVSTIFVVLTGVQILMGDGSFYNQFIFVSFLATTVLIKIFWGPILAHWEDCSRRLKNLPAARLITIAADGGILLFLIAAVYMPDVRGVKAAVFSIDKFYHFDSVVMSPALAYLKGLIVNIDAQSIYGVGIPVILGRLAQGLGGFSYENIIAVMMAMVIAYAIGFYVLLRLWTRDTILSLSGLLLFISWQLFNVDSLILTWPNRTPVRYFFDVILLLFLFLHSRYRRICYLTLASITTGIALFYTYDSGVYQFILLCSYIAYLVISPNQNLFDGSKRRKYIGAAVAFALPPVIFLFLAWQVSGLYVFGLDYWKNILFMIREFCANGALPFYDNLTHFRFGKFFLGCVILSTYLITLVYVAALDFFRKTAKENAFVIALSIYGLSLFQYYVWRGSDVNYFVVCGPFILILIFWLRELREKLQPSAKSFFSVAVLIGSVAILGANENFSKCPNLLSGGHVHLEGNKIFMEKALSIDEDASLIKRLTRGEERVCLISSFATAILIEADRKPLFYSAPLLRSTFFFDRQEAYGSANFFHKGDEDQRAIQVEMNRLIEYRPEYVFIEKRIVLKIGNVAAFYKPGYFLTQVTEYLLKNYTPAFEQGVNLFVLKRR